MTAEPIGHPHFLTAKRAQHLEVLHKAIGIGLLQAARHLSQFVGQSIVVDAPRMGLCQIEDLTACTLGIAFEESPSNEAEQIKTGIYLGIGGDIEGHFIMLLEPDDARSLVEPLIQELAVAPAQREEIMQSAIAEMGNITSSGVLNALADAAHLRIYPSCPAVVTDMAGAILELPMLDIAQYADEALYIETQITMDSVATRGAIAIIPHPDGLEKLIQQLIRTAGKGR